MSVELERVSISVDSLFLFFIVVSIWLVVSLARVHGERMELWIVLVMLLSYALLSTGYYNRRYIMSCIRF